MGAQGRQGTPVEIQGSSATFRGNAVAGIPETKVIEFKNVTKGYGDRVLIDNLSFSMPKGAIVGVIGGNGAGNAC